MSSILQADSRDADTATELEIIYNTVKLGLSQIKVD